MRRILYIDLAGIASNQFISRLNLYILNVLTLQKTQKDSSLISEIKYISLMHISQGEYED